jgi:hypothetical protein
MAYATLHHQKEENFFPVPHFVLYSLVNFHLLFKLVVVYTTYIIVKYLLSISMLDYSGATSLCSGFIQNKHFQ